MKEYLISAVDKSDVKNLKMLIHPYFETIGSTKYFKESLEKTQEEIFTMLEKGDLFYTIISSGSYIIDDFEYHFFQITKELEVKNKIGVYDRFYLKLSKMDINVLSLNHLPSFYAGEEGKYYIYYKR